MYYFDNSATTLVHKEVLDTFMQVSNQYYANPSSLHILGNQANQLLQGAREQVANLLEFKKEEIYFTSSGTEANNWVLQGTIRLQKHLRPTANKILISSVEHPSISNQIHLLEGLGFEVELIPVTSEGIIDIEALNQMLDSNVYLISTMAVNNEVGAKQPIKEIAECLQPYPQIIWHVDGVQAISLFPFLKKIRRIDALTLSGHKFHSVRGTGILCLRDRVQITPLLFGGGQEQNLRSSTENLASIVATAKALRLSLETLTQVSERLSHYRQAIVEVLKNKGWTLFALDSGVPTIICAALPPVPGEVLVHAFEDERVIVSTTSACSSRQGQSHATLLAMGINESVAKSAIRISLSIQTREEEIQGLIRSIEAVSQRFQHLR